MWHIILNIAYFILIKKKKNVLYKTELKYDYFTDLHAFYNNRVNFEKEYQNEGFRHFSDGWVGPKHVYFGSGLSGLTGIPQDLNFPECDIMPYFCLLLVSFFIGRRQDEKNNLTLT